MLNSITVYANKRFLILLLPLPLSDSSGKDSLSTSEGEKAAAALQKSSHKAKDLQVTLNLLLSVKADGVEEQIQQFESKLASMKERLLTRFEAMRGKCCAFV